jgi:hypothetical protein
MNRAAILDAATARRAGLAGKAITREQTPCGTARTTAHPAQMRSSTVERDGKSYTRLVGTASSYERAYEMWDWWGPYTEVVSLGAGKRSLAAGPDVAFLVNHRGLTMARTVSGTLELSEDDTGLQSTAWLNPKRTDVKDLAAAIDDGDVTEMSFAFSIERGSWSPDYTEFRIDEYDIDRGDVSAVNFGANPNTLIEARNAELLTLLRGMDGAAARAARDALTQRVGTQRRYGRIIAELGEIKARVEARALTPADSAVLTGLLVQLAAADAAMDPVVDALCAGDEALDLAQLTLSGLLGITNPDPDDEQQLAQGPANTGLSLRLAEAMLATA